VGTFGVDANGEATSGLNQEGESTDATSRDGAPRMSDEVRESGRSKGGACSGAKSVRPTRDGRSQKDKAKPYCITRIEVLEAYFKVKSNKGAAGVDEQTIEDSSAASVRPSRRTRRERSVTRSAVGNCTYVRRSPSLNSQRRSTRSFVGGSTTTVALILRRSGPSSGMSANRWFAGLVANTRRCVAIADARGNGCFG
jgi:hypothetical protein